MSEEIDYSPQKILNRLKEINGIYTDTQLATLLDVNRNTIAAWRTRNTLDYPTVLKYCATFGLSLDVIFFGLPDKKITDAILHEDSMHGAEAVLQSLKEHIKEAKDLTDNLSSVKDFLKSIEDDNNELNKTSTYKRDLKVDGNKITYTFSSKRKK